MKREIFINVHIPKCGGTTLQNIYKRNFGKTFVQDYTIPSSPQYTISQMEEVLAHYTQMKCFSAHKVSFELPFSNPEYDIIAITFVRDPIDRFFSHYFYHRHHRRDTPKVQKDMLLDEYIDYALVKGNVKTYINGQTLFLSHDASEKGLNAIKDLTKKQKVFVFPMKRMMESLMLLEKLFPNQFKDCSYAIENTSQKDQDVTKEMREMVKPYCCVDYELLKFSNEFLDEQLKKNFDDASYKIAYDNFAKRNSKREMLKKTKDYAILPFKTTKRIIFKTLGIKKS